jgi:hypothetical protein
MTGAPAALVAAIDLQFVWIGIGLATNWDPYPFGRTPRLIASTSDPSRPRWALCGLSPTAGSRPAISSLQYRQRRILSERSGRTNAVAAGRFAGFVKNLEKRLDDVDYIGKTMVEFCSAPISASVCK